MRKTLGIVLYVVAGFFVYMVCVLSFINQPAKPKWLIVASFAVPALLALFVGLAVNRFHNWKRHTGIVLLSSAIFTCFLVFSIMCFLTIDEFNQMMQPDKLDLFSAYVSGFIFTLSMGVLAILLLRMGKNGAEPINSADPKGRAAD